jgi:chromosome segregation ATPase
VEAQLASVQQQAQQTHTQLTQQLGAQREATLQLDTQLKQAKADLAEREKQLVRDAHQLQQAKETEGRLVQERDQVQSHLSATEKELTQTTQELEVSAREKATLSEQLTRTQDELASTKTQISQYKVKQTELDQLKRAVSKAEREIEQLTGERAHLKDEVAALKQEGLASQDHGVRLERQLKREGEELAAARQANTQLEARVAGLQRDQQALQGELAARDKANTALQDELAQMTKRFAQRDDQLQQLREIHTALDQQYASLEANHRGLEQQFKESERQKSILSARLTQMQDELAAAQQRAQDANTQLTQQIDESRSEFRMTDEALTQARQESERLQREKATLSEQLAQAQQASAAAHQQAQEMQGRLMGEVDQARQRHQELVKELETLHTTQLVLEQQLTTTREHGVGMEANLAGARTDKAKLEETVIERDVQLADARKQLQNLGQTLEAKERELAEVQRGLADGQQDRLNLQEQLRIAKETQGTFNEQLKGLQVVQAERDQMQTALNEREAQAAKLQGEITSLSRDLEMAKRQLQLAQAQDKEHGEQIAIDRKGLEWRIESLERDLKETRAAEARLQVELENRASEEQAQQAFKEQLTKQLTEREAQLKQAEAMIQLLQSSQGGEAAAKRLPVQESVSVKASAAVQKPVGEMSVAPPNKGSESTQLLPTKDYPITVYQVNDEWGFLVVSMGEMGWATSGTELLLVSQDKPVVSVQLTELDGAGFAVAQITRTIDPAKQIRKGDLLFARPLPNPGGQ